MLALRVLKSKEFARFARKNRIADSELCRAVAELHAGAVDANLGGGVFKQRLRRRGEGKSGGFRTIILLRIGSIAIFVYGFAKSDRPNISSAELEVWRTIAKDLLVEDASLQAALHEGKLMEVACNEAEIS